jgi:hypothetical protein
VGDRAEVIATVYFGDNYFHERKAEALAAIVAELEKCRPDIVVAGPAFNAGRYGLACVEICQTIGERLGLSSVTGMELENPGVGIYREYHNRCDEQRIRPSGAASGDRERDVSDSRTDRCESNRQSSCNSPSLRREIVMTALKALETKVENTTVFTPKITASGL